MTIILCTVCGKKRKENPRIVESEPQPLYETMFIPPHYLRIYNTYGDGYCLYDALSQSLLHVRYSLTKDYRFEVFRDVLQKIVDRAYKLHRSKTVWFMKALNHAEYGLRGREISAYLGDIANATIWGGQLECMIAVDIWKYDVHFKVGHEAGARSMLDEIKKYDATYEIDTVRCLKVALVPQFDHLNTEKRANHFVALLPKVYKFNFIGKWSSIAEGHRIVNAFLPRATHCPTGLFYHQLLRQREILQIREEEADRMSDDNDCSPSTQAPTIPQRRGSKTDHKKIKKRRRKPKASASSSKRQNIPKVSSRDSAPSPTKKKTRTTKSTRPSPPTGALPRVSGAKGNMSQDDAMDTSDTTSSSATSAKPTARALFPALRDVENDLLSQVSLHQINMI